jgi:hypothetical protein
MAIPFQNANLTLAQMRSFVAQLSDLEIGTTENVDIQIDLVNGFIKEGFQKVVALSVRWPYYQTTYGIAVLQNTRAYTSFTQTQPTAIGSSTKAITDIAQIIAVVNSDSAYAGNALIYIDQARAESLWVGTNDQPGPPAYYSVWANQLNIWPLPDNNYSFTIRGYRNPSLAWLSDDNALIDISPQLQLPLVNYVMARVFQYQEDNEMANAYMRNFEQGIAVLENNLTAPNSNRQLIMSGGLVLNGPQNTAYGWSDGPGIQVMPGSPNPIAFGW